MSILYIDTDDLYCKGDVEFALGLRTYVQSVVCTEQCDVFFLNARNYERLVIKKHLTTAEVGRLILMLYALYTIKTALTQGNTLRSGSRPVVCLMK